MFHMITDNIEAYRDAVKATTTASIAANKPAVKNPDLYDELNNCVEEERIRLDGLTAIIGIAIREAAAAQPHNPFSITGEVNQPPVKPRSRLAQALQEDPPVRTVRNQYGTFPPPPRKTK